ncbi:MAG: nucleotidyltransferase domain-containing protein [Chloroflexota bacterium]
MKYGLPQSAIQKICAVLSRHPQVDKAILYGSRAKGNYKNGSDIDLTLRGGKELTLQVLYRIMDELDDLLLPYTFDLSILNLIGDSDVIEHIQRVGVIFYDKEETSDKLAVTA